MRIEIIEPGGFKHAGVQYTEADTVTVDDALGTYFCNASWAKDLSGKVETAPRDPNRVVTLDVAPATHAVNVEEPN